MIRKSSFAIAGALALALAACGPTPEEQLARAEQAYADHRFSEARLDLGSLLQEDAANPQVLEMMARVQLHMANGDGARTTLERLQATGQVPADFTALLAEAMLLQGEFEGALAAGEALGNAEGLRIAALAHAALGNRDAARETFERAVGGRGDRARAYADYARFLLADGDLPYASTMAGAALQADAEGLEALLANAMVARDNGDPEAALGYYRQAQDIWPESGAALHGQIGILADMGRIGEAEPLIAEAARRDPGNPDVLLLQARLAASNADWREVRQLLQAVEDSEDPQIQLFYARSLVEIGLPEQALPRLTAAVRRSPDDYQLRRLLAETQVSVGDARAAFDTIRPLATSIEASPQDLAIYADAARRSGRRAQVLPALLDAPAPGHVGEQMAAAESYMTEGKWREAAAVYEPMRRWTGDSNAMLLNNLAYARTQLGQTDAALDLALAALRIAPEHPNVMATAGTLLVDTGQDRARGLALLESAAHKAPGNAMIAQSLAAAREG